MIVKIKLHKRSTFRKILDYILNDKDRLYNKSQKSFVVTQNLIGKNIDDWERQLKQNETMRQRKRVDSVYYSHEILSWHREDTKNITLEKMEDMTREYIRLRGSKGMYVAAPHFDKEHYHVHIMVSGIEYKSGKGMRLSKTALIELKQDIQRYQLEKFPELSYSVVNHDRKQKSISGEKEYQMKYRSGRETEKEKVIAKINACYNKANSKEDFFRLLNTTGLKTYERGRRITGVVQDKYKFRLQRLGFTEIKLEELNMTRDRKQELSQSRSRASTLNIRKER